LGRPAGRGRGSGQVGWAGWAEFGGKKFFLNKKIGFLNIQRLWKFVGDLGGILRWGFFLNSSRLLKDFRKI
jgi:hypothetical protein